MYKTLTSLILAAATNCPLVPLQGTYMVQLITDESSINLYPTKINGRGCPAKGGGKVIIQPDGLMIPIQVNTWGPNNFDFGGRGEFAGRVESGNEPMQWVGTSSHPYFAVEYTGTVRQGQLSGQFVAQSSQGKVKCNGKLMGFKVSK
ncbi:hypothetical protein NIES3804_09130 [Microcystis aeruginosa NIES-3804]|uniref:Uncharacterized protein n=2 Tax=Microcystis aeruginosa TaxID=1126 RepID=A0A6H9GHE2_MICAE|nr:hypothetical protein MiTa_02306 [Microcystis aeruginosa NIES-4264]GCL49359.1 hypothetical protein NIES3804_09130 [Microcystis aeruginosa NIES-3804]